MFEYIIIGAGVTGLTLCKKLREKGIDNILVLEKEKEAGGLCRTRNIDGHTLDIGGGHFFHTKHQRVFDYVFQHLPEEEFNYYKRVSKIELDGVTIDYPVESNIWQVPVREQISYLISVVRNGESMGREEPQNYEEWIRWKLGDKICDNYMIPYNKKLWGVEPREMDVDWLYKIPRVDVEEVLQYALEKKQDVSKFPAHIYFYYPKQGGFQRIVDAIGRDEMDRIEFGITVDKLHYTGENWIINDTWETKNIINTAPWNSLYAALGEPAHLAEEFAKIRYNRIVVSLREAEYAHDWHWRYIPSMDKRHHREFYIHNYAQDSRTDGIYLETGLERFQSSREDKNVDFVTDAAYPIPVLGHQKAVSRILEYYQDQHLYGVGRWGQQAYQNADVSMLEAMKFVDRVMV